MDNTLSDEQLIARIARDDDRAFEFLYDRYAALVMGLALKILQDKTTAEEVVQETFWRIWICASTYQAHRGTLKNWLLGTALHLAMDNWRRQARPQPTAED